MVSVEERMKVLNLLQTGAISAEQAAQLLQAMDSGQPVPVDAPPAGAAWDAQPAFSTPSQPDMGRPWAGSDDPDQQEPMPEPPHAPAASITPQPPAQPGKRARWLIVRVSDMKTGRPRVNVRLPLSLVGFGLKMGRQFAPQMEGMDIDQLAQVLQAGEPGPFVDVYDEDDGEHVEVFLE